MAYSTWANTVPGFFQGMVPGVHNKRPLGQQLGADHAVAADAAEQGIHPRRQLSGREGLRHIVVRTGHQAGHLVHFLCSGGEHNDADLLAGGADAAADLEAVDVRQHNIQNGNADVRVFCQTVKRLLAGSSLDGIVASPLQIDHHKAADVHFIFQYQNFFHSPPLSSPKYSSPDGSGGN